MSLRALLFCPDEKTAKIVTQVLGEVDFSVEQASEPFGAVKKLSNQPFDALVVDCANEQDAGLLMKSARNSGSNQGSLIVALVEGQIGVANAFRIGANLVLTKPVAVEQAKSTLRVARGLLRKGGDAVAVPLSPARPSAAHASSTTPAPRPVQATTPTATPRTIPVAPPPQSRPVAAPAAAMTSNLEVEAEQAPTPDAAEAGLLESMTSASTSYATAPAPAPGATSVRTDFQKPIAQQFQPAPEMSGSELTTFDVPIQTSASSHVVEPAIPVHAPDASAAAAPARALAAPAPKVAPARENESSHSGTSDPVAYPDFPDLHPKEEAETSRKAPLVAVAAILFVALAFYFGWSALRGSKAGQKPSETPATSTAPVFPSEPTAPAPVPATASAPAKSAPSPEAITKFVVPTTEVAPNTVTKSQNSDGSSTPAIGKAPLQVHSGKRLDHEASASDTPDAGPAPSIGAVTNSETGDALSTLVASTPATLPSAAPEAVRISQGVSQGLLLKRVQPVYPQQARQARIEGTVELLATIGKDGSIKDVKVVSGPPILGKVAVDAVRQWKYKPYYLNGDPVEVQTQIALNFRLPN